MSAAASCPTPTARMIRSTSSACYARSSRSASTPCTWSRSWSAVLMRAAGMARHRSLHKEKRGYRIKMTKAEETPMSQEPAIDGVKVLVGHAVRHTQGHDRQILEIIEETAH